MLSHHKWSVWDFYSANLTVGASQELKPLEGSVGYLHIQIYFLWLQGKWCFPSRLETDFYLFFFYIKVNGRSLRHCAQSWHVKQMNHWSSWINMSRCRDARLQKGSPSLRFSLASTCCHWERSPPHQSRGPGAALLCISQASWELSAGHPPPIHSSVLISLEKEECHSKLSLIMGGGGSHKHFILFVKWEETWRAGYWCFWIKCFPYGNSRETSANESF